MSSETQSSGVQASRALFPIRTVSKLTGVNAVTLRAWERRYGLIHPERTLKGHRLYRQEDIDLVQWVVDQLKKGVSISQVKLMIETNKGTAPNVKSETTTDHVWASYQTHMVNALAKFDEAKLNSVYNEVLSLYPIDIVTARLIIPMLKIIGLRWERLDGLVAEEHFFSTYLRNKIGARFHHQSQQNRHSSKLICACLPGEYHEVGLLLFCLSAIEMDYQVINLGANAPLDELPIVAQRSHADAIILSGSNSIYVEVINEDLARLSKSVDIPVFIGGRVSTILDQSIVAAGGIPLGNNISQALDTIGNMLTTTRT